jgi:hypothetical protein
MSNKFGILRVGTCNNKLLIKRERTLLQMAMRTNVHLNQKDVAYFVKAMRHYKDKETLIVPFNMGNHWVTLSIFTKYDQVWYHDSLRPTDPRSSD